MAGVPAAITAAMDAKGNHAVGAATDTIADHATSHLKFDPKPLATVLSAMYRDAGVVGTANAIRELPTMKVTLSSRANALDWDTWEPGNPPAASVFDHGKMSKVLAQIDVRISGMSDSLQNRIGNAIADGLASGDALGTVRSAVQSAVAALTNDPLRSQLIARTETNRAYNSATIDQYQQFGLEQFDWLPDDNACEECLDQAQDNPHDISDDTPPLHPNCECTTLGVVPLTA